MLVNKDNEWLKKLVCDFTVEVGRTTSNIGEIQSWKKGHVIKLDESTVNELSLFINDKKVGSGNIMRKPDGEMCLHINEFLSESEVFEDVSENSNM